MDYFYQQLAAGMEVPTKQGVECSVRVFPWTETFVKDGKIVHYFEFDEMTDEAFFKGRIEAWKAFFESLVESASPVDSHGPLDQLDDHVDVGVRSDVEDQIKLGVDVAN
jgi:hypothetical protein